MLGQQWYENGGFGRFVFIMALLVVVLVISGALKLVEAVRHWRTRRRRGLPEQDPPRRE